MRFRCKILLNIPDGDLTKPLYPTGLSTRPAKSLGSDEIWTKAEGALRDALEKTGRKFKIYPGDGAFCGPKIDFQLIDSLERRWQCGTVQLDFSMPTKFLASSISAPTTRLILP